MEKPAISFLVNRIGALLIEEGRYLYGVKQKVEEILLELKRMQCFLEDADVAEDADSRVGNWFEEIRELAYDTEGIIETYLIKVVSQKERGVLKRFTGVFNKWKTIYNVGREIDEIKGKMSNINTSLQTYGIGASQGMAFKTNRDRNRDRNWRRSYAHLVEEEVVGLGEDISIVVKNLVEVGDCRVVSVFGMGGLGKTTLARRVYHHPDVKEHFQHFAWSCISQEYQRRDILQGMLIKLSTYERNEVANMRDEELFEQLCQVQKQTKCLIVLDDIWSMDAWHDLRPAFPDGNTGSKILLTTRDKAVASQVNPHHFLHEPRCLNVDEGWDLLQKKSVLRRDTVGSEAYKEIEKIGKQMVNRCGGLPLAIIVLGGILVDKQTPTEWEEVSQRSKSDKQYDVVPRVLALSYQDLPYMYKPCFLYLSHFPEDYVIPAKKLYNLWMAEGFLSIDDREEEETMMDVAERYLGELAQRCMIQVQIKESTGRIKSCRMHDLMREMCISKARKQNFVRIIHLQSENGLTDCCSSTTPKKIRRLAVHLNRDVERVVLPGLDTFQHLKSVLFFSSHGSGQLEIYHFKNFKLLNVVDLEGYKFRGKSVEAIGKIITLRYLGLRHCDMMELSPPLSMLQYLQTLDLQSAALGFGTTITLQKMERLRHLYVSHHSDLGHKFKLHELSQLETLEEFHTSACDVNDLCKLDNLRQLKATFFERDNQDLAAFVNYLSISTSHLRKTKLFILYNFSSDEKLCLLKQLLRCHHLYKLHIDGVMLEFPEYQCFSPHLVNLTLSNCKLNEDPMPTLEKLPCLKRLELSIDSFMGDTMVCSSNGFSHLKYIKFYWLPSWKKWTVQKGSMQNLSALNICRCYELEMVPEELRFITTFEELFIRKMTATFKARLRGFKWRGKEFYKAQRVPFMHIY